MVGRRVEVALPEDDHPDVRVEVDFTGPAASQSENRDKYGLDILT